MFKRPLALAMLAAVVATGLAIVVMPDAQAAPANPVTPQADPTTGASSPDTEPPTTPTNLTVSFRCDATLGVLVTLNWAASTDNVGVTGYDIYATQGVSSDSYALVATTTTTSYTQRVTLGYFKVRARDAAGNASDFTAPLLVAPPPLPCPTYSTSPSASASVSPPPDHGTCGAAYKLINVWPGGFQAQVTVTNTGSDATNSWAVTMTFANGVTISQTWGATTKDTASPYTFSNLAYNGVLAPGASTTFGFIGTSTGTSIILAASCTRTP